MQYLEYIDYYKELNNINKINYLEYLNNFEYRTKLFYINLNWFSSWFFILPLFITDNNSTHESDYIIILNCILIPSIIRHAHFAFISHYITLCEKWLIIFSIAFLFSKRITYISNTGMESLNIYDIGIVFSITSNSYIYFIKNLSYSKYGILWHSLIHLIGSFGLICRFLAY
jgi:hypothetical protein